MSSQEGFKNSMLYQENYVIDENVEQEMAKKQFENSIASIGDLYKLDKVNEIMSTKNRIKKQSLSPKRFSNEPSIHNINKMYIGDFKNDNNADNTVLYVNYLRSAKLNPSKKYTHVKGGRINPPKSSYSLKPATEKKIQAHEDKIKEVTLYANRINIHHNICKHERKISPIRKAANENYSDEEQKINLVMIGSAPNEYLNRTQKINSSNILNNTNRSNKLKSKGNFNHQNQDRVRESSKESRNLLKKYEKLYFHTKDFFTSNANKVPSSSGIDDIINFADDMRTSLETYKKKFEKLPKRPNSEYLMKDSITKMKQKIIKPKSPKKYIDINPEDRKKIEEKLEMLHVEIRTVFDNMNKIEEKSEKVEDLIQKSQNLSKLLKSFAQSANMSQFHSNAVNTTIPVGLKESVVIEANETLYNNDINQYNTTMQKNNEVDEVINVLKGNMSTLQVDDNKIIFDHSNNNFTNKNFNLNNSNNLYTSTGQNYNTGNEIVNFQTQSQNFNPGKSTNMNFYNSYNQNMMQSQVNNTGTGNNFYSGQNNFNNTGANFNTNQNNVSYQINPNNPNNPNNDNNTNPNNPNNDNNTNPNNPNNDNNTNPNMTINNTTNKQYAKLNTANVIYEGRFAAYDVELPINYYYNYTKLNEPSPDKDWCLRPHHIETVSKNPKAIPDDLMNTKYISYYGTVPKEEAKKSRENHLSEVIGSLETNIDKLKSELYTKATVNEEYGSLYKRLEILKEEVKKTYVPGKILNDLTKSKTQITGMLSERDNKSSYSDMYNQNSDISQSNLVIKSYETLLKEMRDKERFLLLQKRKDEYEKIRPPLENWWELKSRQFQEELQRNKMVLNATPDYFDKLQDLKNEHLY